MQLTASLTAPAPWLPHLHGKPESLNPHIDDDLQHQLGLYHAALNILAAPFRDSCDNGHIRSAENHHHALKQPATLPGCTHLTNSRCLCVHYMYRGKAVVSQGTRWNLHHRAHRASWADDRPGPQNGKGDSNGHTQRYRHVPPTAQLHADADAWGLCQDPQIPQSAGATQGKNQHSVPSPRGAPCCTHSISKACFCCLVPGITVPTMRESLAGRPATE